LDLQGVQTLHQQDIDATLSGDPQALADLFTQYAVLLEPGSAAVIGRSAILAENMKHRAEHPNAKILSHKPDIRDTQIAEGWVFEWGCFDSTFRKSEKGEVKSFRGKAGRILKREPNGSWTFSRVMWNLAEDRGPGH
jgi:ketosteroid isomerase-like protein